VPSAGKDVIPAPDLGHFLDDLGSARGQRDPMLEARLHPAGRYRPNVAIEIYLVPL
jgi:hypothetical protein